MRFVTVTVIDPSSPADLPPVHEDTVWASDTRSAIREVVDTLISDYTLTPTYSWHADGTADVLVTQRSDGAVVGTLCAYTS